VERSTESIGQLGVIWPEMIEQESFDAPSAVSDDSLINTLVEADCLEVLAQVPDASVNLILCDLPFGTTQNRWDSVIPLERLWAHYRRVLAPRGAVVLNSQGAFTARLILSNEQWFKYKLAWVKSKPTGFLNAKRQPLRKHEDICVFYPRPPKYFPQMTAGTAYSKGIRKDQHTGSYGEFKPILVASDGARYPTDAIYFKTAESEGPVWHPTQKPVALGRYLVRTFTEGGDLVLDNAFGSGSYLVAALLEGRNFIGIEMNQHVNRFKSHPVDYIAVAESRLTKAYVEMDADARRRLRWPLSTIRAAN
jgi:site-specific DNA-methyltransferase (adenine-specific)/modification methylase